MGPQTRRNTGTDFQEQIDRLFRGGEEPDTQEEEEPNDGDKNGEDTC